MAKAGILEALRQGTNVPQIAHQGIPEKLSITSPRGTPITVTAGYGLEAVATGTVRGISTEDGHNTAASGDKKLNIVPLHMGARLKGNLVQAWAVTMPGTTACGITKQAGNTWSFDTTATNKPFTILSVGPIWNVGDTNAVIEVEVSTFPVVI